MSERAARRRLVVAVLDELAAAGVIRFEISSRDFDGPEPQIQVSAQAAAIDKPLPAGLSHAAVEMWDALRLLGGI
jgi:hypothetical protein